MAASGMTAALDALMARVKAPCSRDVSLAQHTTFRIGGPADVLAQPRNEEEVLELLAALKDLSIPWTVLGGGSNVLIGDKGIRGCVIQLEGTLCSVVVSEGGKRVDVGAGASFAKLTKTCMALGWPGSNGWVGTPGTVGGAFIMNAGSREGEVGACVSAVRLVVDGAVKEVAHDACGFSYRRSTFPAQSVLLSGVLRCENANVEDASTIQATAKESLRKRHLSQPKEHSAGSIFKNPPGNFAGRLIEAAGLKGTSVGGALISPTHANFIVNTGSATAADVLALATQAQAAVLAQSGISLEWEVRKIGEFA